MMHLRRTVDLDNGVLWRSSPLALAIAAANIVNFWSDKLIRLGVDDTFGEDKISLRICDFLFLGLCSQSVDWVTSFL